VFVTANTPCSFGVFYIVLQLQLVYPVPLFQRCSVTAVTTFLPCPLVSEVFCYCSYNLFILFSCFRGVLLLQLQLVYPVLLFQRCSVTAVTTCLPCPLVSEVFCYCSYNLCNDDSRPVPSILITVLLLFLSYNSDLL
jgi:hypothetical protein